jgi:hypothetical protein
MQKSKKWAKCRANPNSKGMTAIELRTAVELGTIDETGAGQLIPRGHPRGELLIRGRVNRVRSVQPRAGATQHVAGNPTQRISQGANKRKNAEINDAGQVVAE